MRFHVDGFEWEASQARPGQLMKTRTEALSALERVPPAGTSSSHYRQARAALSVRDYGQVVACCEAASEVADPARWQ